MIAYRVPLPAGHVGHLDEQPLTRDILETRLDDTQFHGARGMNKDLGQPSGTTSPDFSVNSFSEINNARPHDESPTLITQTVLGGVEGEHGDVVGVGGVTNEASGSMGVETNHEEEREVVRVPEGLEALVADLVMRGGIHEDHNQEHEVAADASCLLVVNVQREARTDLCGGGIRSVAHSGLLRGSTYGDVQR